MGKTFQRKSLMPSGFHPSPAKAAERAAETRGLAAEEQAASPARVFAATWLGWMLDGFGAGITRFAARARNHAGQRPYRALRRLSLLHFHGWLGLFDVLGLARRPGRARAGDVLDHPALFRRHRFVRRSAESRLVCAVSVSRRLRHRRRVGGRHAAAA